MGNLLYLVIGLIAGLILFAIARAIFGGGSKNSEPQVDDNTAAELAKAEVKIAVLEDKLRLEEADHESKQASLEAAYQEKLDAAEVGYRDNLGEMQTRFLALESAIAAAPAFDDVDETPAEALLPPTAEEVKAAAESEASTMAALAAAEAVQHEDDADLYGMSIEMDLDEEDLEDEDDIYGHSFEMDWGDEEPDFAADELEDTLETDRAAILAAIAALEAAGLAEDEEEAVEVSPSFELAEEAEIEEPMEVSYSFDMATDEEAALVDDAAEENMAGLAAVAAAAGVGAAALVGDDDQEETAVEIEAAQEDAAEMAPAVDEGMRVARLAAAAAAGVGAAASAGDDQEETADDVEAAHEGDAECPPPRMKTWKWLG